MVVWVETPDRTAASWLRNTKGCSPHEVTLQGFKVNHKHPSLEEQVTEKTRNKLNLTSACIQLYSLSSIIQKEVTLTPISSSSSAG